MGILVWFDRKFGLARINAGRKTSDPHSPHVINKDTELIRLVHIKTHGGGIEFRRIMRLQPGGLVCEQCIGGSMRSEEHTSELQSLMRISYAVFCLKKKKHINYTKLNEQQ